jgi:hypothetical protein
MKNMVGKDSSKAGRLKYVSTVSTVSLWLYFLKIYLNNIKRQQKKKKKSINESVRNEKYPKECYFQLKNLIFLTL